MTWASLTQWTRGSARQSHRPRWTYRRVARAGDRPARPERRRKVHTDQHAARLSSAHRRDGPRLRPRCPRDRARIRQDRLHAGERFLHRQHERRAFRPLHGRTRRPALRQKRWSAPTKRSSMSASARSVPQGQHLLAGHEAARQAGPGARARPQAAHPRRAYQRPRSHGAPAHDPAHQEIRKEGSVRLLISSHLLRDIDETCDEVLILKQGRIAALCNIEAERRSNRNFMELETVGATEKFSVKHPRTWLRMRVLSRRTHQACDARPHRSARSVCHCRRTGSADSPHEPAARFSRRHLPAGDGQRESGRPTHVGL